MGKMYVLRDVERWDRWDRWKGAVVVSWLQLTMPLTERHGHGPRATPDRTPRNPQPPKAAPDSTIKCPRVEKNVDNHNW